MRFKSLYLTSFAWSKTTLICRDVRGAWASPPTSKKGTFFVVPMTLRMPILNKKYHQARIEEWLKVFEGFFLPE